MFKKYMKFIVPLLFGLILIFIYRMSNMNMEASSSLSRYVTNLLIDVLGVNIRNGRHYMAIHALVRQMAHFGMYLCLSFVMSQVLTLVGHKLQFRRFITFGVGVFIAIVDEVNQMSVIGRDAQFEDLILDAVGILVGIVLWSAFDKINRGKWKRETVEMD